jgi:hypothetical protein
MSGFRFVKKSLEQRTQELMQERGKPWTMNWQAARVELSRRSAVCRHARAVARKCGRLVASPVQRYTGPGVVAPRPAEVPPQESLRSLPGALMTWHRVSWACPCASCRDSRAVEIRLLIALGILLALYVAWAWFSCVPAGPLNNLPASDGGAVTANRSLTPHVAPAGADKTGGTFIQRVAPSVVNVRIGAPLFDAKALTFVSTWRWQLRGGNVATGEPCRRRRHVRLTVKFKAKPTWWCGRWSDNS